MKWFKILTPAQPYTVYIQIAVKADTWEDVVKQYPDAEYIEVIEE